jgi:hypothetical protein
MVDKMAMVKRMSRRNLVILALVAGVLVGGVLLLAIWPRGICDLSPCTLHPGSVCSLIRIIGPCPVGASTIVVPLVVGFVVAAVVLICGIWLRRRWLRLPV